MAKNPDRLYSRRSFLESVPLAGAGALLATILGSKLPMLRLRRRVPPPVFHKGSIFTPVKDSRKRT